MPDSFNVIEEAGWIVVTFHLMPLDMRVAQRPTMYVSRIALRQLVPVSLTNLPDRWFWKEFAAIEWTLQELEESAVAVSSSSTTALSVDVRADLVQGKPEHRDVATAPETPLLTPHEEISTQTTPPEEAPPAQQSPVL